MPTKVLSQASRTVRFFHAPVLNPEANFTNPFLMAGRSVGDGGVSSTRAYFMKTPNFGLACVRRAENINNIYNKLIIFFPLCNFR